MVMTKFVTEFILVKLQAFTMNGNDRYFSGFCDRICLYFKAATKSVFSKFQAFTMNSNDRVCDAVYF